VIIASHRVPLFFVRKTFGKSSSIEPLSQVLRSGVIGNWAFGASLRSEKPSSRDGALILELCLKNLAAQRDHLEAPGRFAALDVILEARPRFTRRRFTRRCLAKR